ncbi:glycosyltransferase family protein [Legionella hackeliae]|uniref:hypothetical protein n=1 Tax=Legionella hackeliae TaxID=449 RepID=UPI001E5D2A0E|nr:hypothetical protein [Legionella hackeliae]
MIEPNTSRIRTSILVIITLFIILISNLHNIKDFMHHQYFVYEQDAYMHLVIASDLLRQGDWYQHFNPRLNAPFGADTHSWTSAITVLLASGGLLLSIFMPLSSALYNWSFWLPIIFFAISAWAMLWVINPLKPSASQQFFVLLAFLFNPFMHSYFIPLRVDYDFFLIPLSIIYWGYLLRFMQTDRISLAITTAIVASLAVWTSISFMLLLLIGLGFLFGLALVKHEIRPYSVAVFLLSLCVGFAVIILLEHRNFLTVAHDVISIVHLIFVLLLTLTFCLYVLLLQNKNRVTKTLFAFTAVLALFLMMNFLFSGFYLGPYNHVDAYLLQHFFPTLSEFYSPFSIDPSLALAILSYFLIGAGYCYFLYLQNSLCGTKLFFLSAATFTILLTIYMYRWVEFAVPLTIILASFILHEIKHSRLSFQLISVAILSALPLFIFSLSNDYFVDSQQLCQQQFYRMLQDKFLEKPQFKKDNIIFVHSNYGPLLLYSTRYSIIATNDHHNPEGLKTSLRFFKASNEEAKQLMQQRNVDLILICPLEQSTAFNPQTSSWLKKIPLPSSYSQWQLYQPN